MLAVASVNSSSRVEHRDAFVSIDSLDIAQWVGPKDEHRGTEGERAGQIAGVFRRQRVSEEREIVPTPSGDVDELSHGGRHARRVEHTMRSRYAPGRGHAIDSSDEKVEALNDEQGDYKVVHRRGPSRGIASVTNQSPWNAQRTADNASEKIRQRVESAVVVAPLYEVAERDDEGGEVDRLSAHEISSVCYRLMRPPYASGTPG